MRGTRHEPWIRPLAAIAMVAALLLSSSSVRAQMPAGEGSGEMDMSSMQGGSALPDARDAHAYSEGVDFTRGTSRPALADVQSFASVFVDNLEAMRVDGTTSIPYDLEAWFGRTYDRAVLKAEGDIESGEIADGRTELLWGHAFAPYWDTQLGVRYDSGEGPNRNWLAFGVEGLAPYWFELEVTGYVGESSRSALRVDASYDMAITQKWVLQPRLEANFYGKRDVERGLGSGLSDISAALRLRYEVRRELAPYIGIEWVNQYGETEDLNRAAGGDPSDTRVVAGVRFWF
jgi:copper resistance protein B